MSPYRVRNLNWNLLVDPISAGLQMETQASSRLGAMIAGGGEDIGKGIVRSRVEKESKRRFDITAAREDRELDLRHKDREDALMLRRDSLMEKTTAEQNKHYRLQKLINPAVPGSAASSLLQEASMGQVDPNGPSATAMRQGVDAFGSPQAAEETIIKTNTWRDNPDFAGAYDTEAKNPVFEYPSLGYPELQDERVAFLGKDRPDYTGLSLRPSSSLSKPSVTPTPKSMMPEAVAPKSMMPQDAPLLGPDGAVLPPPAVSRRLYASALSASEAIKNRREELERAMRDDSLAGESDRAGYELEMKKLETQKIALDASAEEHKANAEMAQHVMLSRFDKADKARDDEAKAVADSLENMGKVDARTVDNAGFSHSSIDQDEEGNLTPEGAAYSKGLYGERAKMAGETQRGEIVTNRQVAKEERGNTEWDRRNAITTADREAFGEKRMAFQRSLHDETMDAAAKKEAKNDYDSSLKTRIAEEGADADDALRLYQKITTPGKNGKNLIGTGQGKYTPAEATAIYKKYEDATKERDRLMREQSTGQAAPAAPAGAASPEARASAAAEWKASTEKTPEVWATIKAKYGIK